MSVIGRIVHRGQVEDAVKDVVKTWLHSYLIQIEQDDDLELGVLDRPKAWVRATNPLALKTAQLPAVVIVSGGWIEDPEWEATEDGLVATLTWQIILTVYGRGNAGVPANALDNTGRLIAAAAAAFANKGATNELISGVRLIDLDLGTNVDSNRERTLTDAQAMFAVRTENALTLGPGLDTPIPADGTPEIPDAPEADTVNITIDPLEDP